MGRNQPRVWLGRLKLYNNMPIIKKVSSSPKRFTFPPQEELERVRKRIARSDRRTNFSLSPWATPVEKTKYGICQNILAYQQDNDISVNKLARQFGLTTARTEAILYSHFNEFNLEELIEYANCLHLSYQVKIKLPYEQEKSSAQAY